MSKPAPFKRPSIDMNRSGRTWQHVKAAQLVKDDVVAERGLVLWAWPFHDDSAGVHEIHVKFFNGDLDSYDTDEIVYAFVRQVEL